MTTQHPDYAVLAARIAISNLHKETKKTFSHVIKDLYTYGASYRPLRMLLCCAGYRYAGSLLKMFDLPLCPDFLRPAYHFRPYSQSKEWQKVSYDLRFML